MRACLLAATTYKPMEIPLEQSDSGGPWVIIPPTVLADSNLAAGEKLLFGRVLGFIRKHGYCLGSNEYLGRYIGLSKQTVKNYLSRLYDLGYLRYEIIRDQNRQVIERRIYPTLVPERVLPLVPYKVRPRTTPRTPEGTEERNTTEKEDVQNHVVEKRDQLAKARYYGDLLGSILGDRQSATFYELACQRYDPHLLMRKAKEIISDGTARRPAAVFVAWLKKQPPRPLSHSSAGADPMDRKNLVTDIGRAT